ncbi:CDP-alcohol phosphatidyltransferase family protein [Streptomyces sp. SL13]|uniref:CDP-alcohol phosphatidyltransferase family protein n=1 Tax=Streptantibioticus silvisoli TaxID=2705255 RepID=A0AA90GYZ1_9ACTN|nr:CDP-alcohol phosphatidyltransferase family protein [Streptantibioticus silvisoli]MDI5964420.1 CDP-alcohol phosphatidyltransferase family protein [Streptantibioticus silvisoli]MDI5969066.1 CDP-alcohol phosphatidyltransferase family protein [Streptantibioticus silvisoli]
MSGGFGTALRSLRTAQKSAKGVSYYSRWVNRPAGRVFAAAGHVLGMTPNAVTAVSALVTGCGIALIALVRPSWPLAVGVVALLVTGFALDSADGQLARLRGGGSRAGEWLDHVVDCVKLLTLHLAVLIAMYRFLRPLATGWLALPLLFQVTAVTTFFGGILTEQLKRSAAGRGAPAPAASALRSLLLLPADYGVFCLLFLSYGAGRAVFLPVYGVLLAANVLLMAALLVKWFRELSAPAARPATAAAPGDPAGPAASPAALS